LRRKTGYKKVGNGMDKYCIHTYKKVGSPICPLCGAVTHAYNWPRVIKEHIQWVKDNPDHEYEYWSI